MGGISKQIVLFTLLSIGFLSSAVPLKSDEELYRVWKVDDIKSNKDDDLASFNYLEETSYKWCKLPRLFNIGFKNPFTNTVIMKKDNSFILDRSLLLIRKNRNIKIKIEIVNPSTAFFTDFLFNKLFISRSFLENQLIDYHHNSGIYDDVHFSYFLNCLFKKVRKVFTENTLYKKVKDEIICELINEDKDIINFLSFYGLKINAYFDKNDTNGK